ncbi:hypothetical protein Tco_1284922 [Tanacetum coccineum]
MDEDELVLIILGRPFLATTQAVIDVHEGKLSLRVKNETVTFNIAKSMKSKHSRNDYMYCADNTAKIVQEQWVDTVDHDGKWTEAEEEGDSNEVQAVSEISNICDESTLSRKLSLRVKNETVTFNIAKSMKSKHSRNDYMYCADNTAKIVQEQWVDTVDHDGKWTEAEKGDSNKVQAVSFYPRAEPVEPLEWKALENWLKPSSVKPPKLELNELPEHLEYAFLQENNQLPVVISSALSTVKKTRLLEVLKKHKVEIAWSIADIKRIDSSFCTH